MARLVGMANRHVFSRFIDMSDAVVAGELSTRISPGSLENCVKAFPASRTATGALAQLS